MKEFNETSVLEYNKALLDDVTALYLDVVGEHFHWGMFNNKNESLYTAQCNLIDKIIGMLPTNRKLKILDVGCGIGSTTKYVSEKYGHIVYGISNNSLGIDEAKKRYDNNNCELQFYLRDALNNKFEKGSFDAIIQIESAYMMPNKIDLLNENYRVLKNNGIMIICDNMYNKSPSVQELAKYIEEIKSSKAIFGEAFYISYEEYKKFALKAGFKNIESFDITPEIYHTIECIMTNLKKGYEDLIKAYSVYKINAFIKAFELSRFVFDNKFSRYGIVKAKK